MRDNDPCRIHGPTLAALDELAELALDPDAVDAARAHLAGCPRCQVRRRLWARLDDALRDALAPTTATPALSTADLLAAIGADHEPRERRAPLLSVISVRDEDIMEDDSHITQLAPAAEAPAPTRGFAPPPTRRQPAWRRALTGLVAVAAVVALLASITGALALTGHLRGARNANNASATQTPTALASNDQITAISMDSATDGWAVEINPQTNGNAVNILHISDGVVVKQTTLAGVAQWPTIQALSPTDVWLMVSDWSNAFYHYDGRAWEPVYLPAPPDAFGNSISVEAFTMRSPTEGWAIATYEIDKATTNGSYGVSAQAFYRYDGSTWRREPADAAATVGSFLDPASTSTTIIQNNVQITGISTTPDGDVWVVGFASSQYQTGGASLFIGFIYHRSGGVWRLAQTLPNVLLDSIAMTGSASGWIIGSQARLVPDVTNPSAKTTSLTPVAYAWNGARWSPTALPLPVQIGTGFYFQPITATGPSNVWALTTSDSAIATPLNSADASEHAYLIHYDGSRWSRVSLPRIAVVNSGQAAGPFNQAYFQRIAAAPNGDLWLTGQLLTDRNSNNLAIPLFYQYTGGQWSSLPLPRM